MHAREAFWEHIDCPRCGRDWYGSTKGVCPECGLPNGGGLAYEYQLGRRLLSIETEGSSSLLRTLFEVAVMPRLFKRLARNASPEPAKRLGRVICVAVWPAYVVLSTLGSAFDRANGGDWIAYSHGRAPIVPTVRDLAEVSPWSAVHGLTALLGIMLIQAFCVSRIAHSRVVSRGDAVRLYSYSLSRLALVLILWPTTYLFMLMCEDWRVGLGSWVFAILWAWAMWARSLRLGIEGLAENANPGQSGRLVRQCLIASMAIWMGGWLASIWLVEHVAGIWLVPE